MPKRVPPGDRRDRQLLVRLTAEQLDWLGTAAFLERVTANEYLFSLVSAHVGALRSSGPVRTAFKVRQAYDEESGGITTLPERSKALDSERAQRPEAGDH